MAEDSFRDLDLDDIGARVYMWRQLVGMSQSEVAKATGKPGVSISTLSKIERGEHKRLTVSQALDLAAAMRVNPLALMLGTKDGTVRIAGQDRDRRVAWDWITRFQPLDETWETEPTERQQQLGIAPWQMTAVPLWAVIDQSITEAIAANFTQEGDTR